MHTRARDESGFGMLELLMAMVMLNVGILAVVAAFSSGNAALARASRISTAAALGNKQMEVYRGLKYDNIVFITSEWNAAIGDSTYTADSIYQQNMASPVAPKALVPTVTSCPANVPANANPGIAHSASTTGGAVLVSYAVNDDWKIASRAEYISSSGNFAAGAPNLLYGLGSDAWSFTITPTYQHGIFFARGEASYVGVGSTAAGYAFGPNLDKGSQARLLLEAGVLF